MNKIIKIEGIWRCHFMKKCKNSFFGNFKGNHVAARNSARFFSATFRHNICSNDWVAFHGRERLNRPHQMKETRKTDKTQTPMWDANCPFCADEEYKRAPKLLTLNSADLELQLFDDLPFSSSNENECHASVQSCSSSLNYSHEDTSTSSSSSAGASTSAKTVEKPPANYSISTDNSGNCRSYAAYSTTTGKGFCDVGTTSYNDPLTNNKNDANFEDKRAIKKAQQVKNYSLHVVQNKYPVVLPSECIILSSEYGATFHVEEPIKECSTLINLLNNPQVQCGVQECIPATGFHEVIVDFPCHYKPMGSCDEKYWHLLFAAFRNRGKVLAEAPLIQSILCFKNSGAFGGASIVHPHSQLVALPIVPQQQQKLLSHAMNYFEANGKCLFCEYMSVELKEKERIIEETDAYVAMVPYAAHIPYHINIFPKKHSHQFLYINDEELRKLAEIVNIVFGKIDCLFNDPDYNLVVRSAHLYRGKWRLYRPEVFYHWHVEIFPRLDSWPVAGFEFGSGIMANSHLPEDDAEAYRTCKLKDKHLW